MLRELFGSKRVFAGWRLALVVFVRVIVRIDDQLTLDGNRPVLAVVEIEATAEASRPDPEPKAEIVPSPFEVGGDVTPPRRLRSPLPAYPDDAWAEGVTGDVLVRAVIDERGEIAGVEVLRGLPYGMTEAAVEAIRRWKFAPATRHGQPVAVYRNLSVRFET